MAPLIKAPLVTYASDSDSDAESDSDFAPDADTARPNLDIDADDSDSSSGSSSKDGDAGKILHPQPGRSALKRKRSGDALHHAAKTQTQTPADGEAEDVGFENSGDEAIISKGRKKRRRKDGGNGGDADEDGGEGGWIKTRRMRAAEKEEKRHKLDKGLVTVDVDALWAQMISGTATQPAPSDPAPEVSREKNPQQPPSEEAAVLIKRSFTFAGKLHTEEKRVPRSSAEARLYLAPQSQAQQQQQATSGSTTNANLDQRPPPRRAFRSVFEPVTDAAASIHRPDLDLSMRGRNEKEGARKLNTVEKSRMDWAGFVDKEGIKDELDLAGRAKGSFAGRQQFLARSETRIEEDARRARAVTRAR